MEGVGRAKERARFDDYLREKEGVEAALERERCEREREMEKVEIKELRKSMSSFKAKRLPNFEKVKFFPKNLHRDEPREGPTLKEHIRSREEKEQMRLREKEESEKAREKKEVEELRKAMSSFKARPAPNFNKKPWRPKNLTRSNKN